MTCIVIISAAFVRPVVLFGAIADVARDKLLQEFPERFESPRKFFFVFVFTTHVVPLGVLPWKM